MSRAITSRLLERLRADLVAHRAARPNVPLPVPPADSVEYRTWDKTHTKWLHVKSHLEFQIDQEHSRLLSAWKPCDSPPDDDLSTPSLQGAP